MKCRLSIGFSLLFYVFIFCFQGSPRTRTICSTCFGVSTRREAVQPFSCKSPSRTGLPTIHCFKRLEATSGVTSGLYCRPSLRSVVERFFHFPSSSSDVPVIPTSSPLSPDGKHRRTSPSTASGNPPAPVTSVPVSPLPPHRTKARYLSGCVRATPVLPKAGSAAPPHGRKRQTPLSPAAKEQVRIVPFRQPDPHRLHPFASKYRDNRIRRLAPRLVGIQHHADRCRISFQQSNMPRTKRRPAQRHRMPEPRRMHRQHILISFHQKDAPLPADRLPCLVQPVQQLALPIQPAVSELTYFGLSRSSSDNLRAANPASRPPRRAQGTPAGSASLSSVREPSRATAPPRNPTR